MSRPRIGITTSFDDDKQSLNIDYVRAIENAGGLPLIVPVLNTPDAAKDLAALLDGLVITGGPGICDNLIGTLPDDLPPTHPARTHADTLIFDAMQARNRPILGICYGMQFINARAGGSIYADVQAQVSGTAAHSSKRGAKDHTVRLAHGSHLAQLLNSSNVMVNSFHIQAVETVGTGLQAVGHSEDGVIEAIESYDGRLLGVQFHPERIADSMQGLFAGFVARCRLD